jgi:hypothetical protein
MARKTLATSARAFSSWPGAFSSASWEMRKTMSLLAPAENLLTIVIGWLAIAARRQARQPKAGTPPAHRQQRGGKRSQHRAGLRHRAQA